MVAASDPYPIRHGPVLHDDGSVTFRVWAPMAARVDLMRDEHPPLPLSQVGDGWFAARTQAAQGDRYAFRLDGAAPRPDPATLRQPDGVHGPSAVVDRAALPWSSHEQRWQPPALSSAVIYELHVGTFTRAGTLAAAAEHLADLRDLGVTHVEVMPLAAFNGTHGWGYDGVCWYAVHEPYGGPEAFAQFVDACHRAGLAVILDVVYNHFGPSGSYHHEFGPYANDRHTTPWGAAINFDGPGADAVRAFVVDNALMWLADFHVDGLRLDAVHALHDGSATPILSELSAAVERLGEQVGRPLVLIAEHDAEDPRVVAPRAAGGMGMTAQWLDDLHHAIHVAVTGERDGYYADYEGLNDVASAYALGFVYGGRWSQHRQRTVGARLPPTVSGRRFVACIQNHDQIGNRVRGRRLTVLAGADQVRLAIALLCLAPTVPMLFMGEEYGAATPFLFFTSHPEPALAESVRQGRRTEFAHFTAFERDEVPDPQDPRTFAASTLDRDEATSPAGMARRLLWTDALRMRRTVRALATGDRTLVDVLLAQKRQMAVMRDDPAGTAPVVVVASADDHDATIALDISGEWRCVWTSTAARYRGPGTAPQVSRTGDRLHCALPPWCVALLERAEA